MNVSLTPELEKFVTEKVGSGMYDASDELETLVALAEAAAEIERGDTELASEFLARMRREPGIRQRVR